MRPRNLIVTTLVIGLFLAPSVVAQENPPVETHETYRPDLPGSACTFVDADRVDSRLAITVATSWKILHDGTMGYSWTIERCSGIYGTAYVVTKDHVHFSGFDLTMVDTGAEKETKVYPVDGSETVAQDLARMEAQRWPTYEAIGDAWLYGVEYFGSFQTDTITGIDGEVHFEGCSTKVGAIPCIHATAVTETYLG